MNANARARSSLEGLSVGDAFGECFFLDDREELLRRIVEREMPEGPWRWTDDTQMAVSVVEVLEQHGHVEAQDLARRFAERLELERGYGRGAFEILTRIAEGVPWRSASQGAFRGRGSFGNGGAMRVAPLGAWFADDRERCVREARASAEVTHAHDEGIAGAIAVAVATSLAWEGARGASFLEAAAEATPDGYVRSGLEDARRIDADASIVEVAKALGNGSGVTAPDTVPLCLWVAAHADDFEAAMWKTVSALGDRDTTCAIVGGILAMRLDVPEPWRARREPLPSASDR